MTADDNKHMRPAPAIVRPKEQRDAETVRTLEIYARAYARLAGLKVIERYGRNNRDVPERD